MKQFKSIKIFSGDNISGWLIWGVQIGTCFFGISKTVPYSQVLDYLEKMTQMRDKMLEHMGDENLEDFRKFEKLWNAYDAIVEALEKEMQITQ